MMPWWKRRARVHRVRDAVAGGRSGGASFRSCVGSCADERPFCHGLPDAPQQATSDPNWPFAELDDEVLRGGGMVAMPGFAESPEAHWIFTRLGLRRTLGAMLPISPVRWAWWG